MNNTDYRHSLLTTCEDIRMCLHGSSDALSAGDIDERIAWLTERRDNWRASSNPNWARYDAAVLELVNSTLAEYVETLASGHWLWSA